MNPDRFQDERASAPLASVAVRLDRGLRCADVALEQRDLKAIAPFVKVVRELNLYHGVNVGPARTEPGELPEIAPTAPPLAYLPGFTVTKLFEDEKSCAKEQLSA